MDFLNQIWTAWNDQWAANVATILSIIAIVISVGDKAHRLTSAVTHWKGWAIILRLYRSGQRKYRMNRAKNAMRLKLARTDVRIPITTYEDCLSENQRTLERNALSAITPGKPAWLSDYYVASALEELSRDCKVVKTTTFKLDNFPPSPQFYLFAGKKAGTSAKQQANEIETESMCLVHQLFQECLEAPRYEIGGRAETTAPGTVQFFTQSKLREGVLPCIRCWEIKTRRNNIRMLVNDITKHDLRTSATLEITGANQEFQEAVIAACVESQCVAEVAVIKKIVERAIEIRAGQIANMPTDLDHETEWTEQLTADFASSLRLYIEIEPG